MFVSQSEEHIQNMLALFKSVLQVSPAGALRLFVSPSAHPFIRRICLESTSGRRLEALSLLPGGLNQSACVPDLPSFLSHCARYHWPITAI